MGLYQKSKELVNEIRRTREFMEFKKAKADVEKYKDLKDEIEKFQKKQMEVFSSNKSKREVEHQLAQLDREFKDLSRIPEVNNLIRAGKNFNDMMFKIYKDINAILDSELKS